MLLLIDSDRVELEGTYPGSGRSLRLGLIQREVDPRSDDEIHTELGSYQFDYRPEACGTQIEVDAHYSANGAFDFTISQLSTGVSLRLREVNQFEGRQIRTPSSPLPPLGADPPPDCDTGSGAGQDPGSGGSAAGFRSESAQGWSQDAHASVIHVANQVLQVASARQTTALGGGDDATAESLNRLAQANADRFDDLDTKTLRVANLVREVCHQLLVAGLLTHEEAGKLARGVDEVR